MRLAIASDLIRISAISAVEYPELVREHAVTGVPKTVVNSRGAILGALPEATFVDRILEAVQPLPPEPR